MVESKEPSPQGGQPAAESLNSTEILARNESIAAATVSDQAAEEDSLGFEPYVMAMAEFLTNSETKPPLTLSIEGEWGSGKSSFMKQLEKAIEAVSQRTYREKQEQKVARLNAEIKRLKKKSQKHRESLRKENRKLIESIVNSLHILSLDSYLYVLHFKFLTTFCFKLYLNVLYIIGKSGNRKFEFNKLEQRIDSLKKQQKQIKKTLTKL